ncbi:MAG: 3-oxoacyl-ACP reductase FabG [Acidobacteria bacterium]|nr:3-oxoacyl-ACP reductase FabG [Acidobacteriota bacterium]
MGKRHEGKVSLITGASRGIGRAIAERLAAEGSDVVLAARTEAACEPVAEAAAAHGVRTMNLALDVGDADSVKAGVKAALDEFGQVDHLINNAGITRDDLLLRLKDDAWDAVLKTDLTGVFLCSRAVLRSMLRRRQGRIVSISSVVGLMGNAGQTNYAAAKAGVHGFTKALAREVASRSITVNAIAPGYVESDMTDGLTDDIKQQLQEQIPLGRMGSGEDIAGVVSFLLSDDAAYMTGQVLSVDGGMYM